MKFDLKSLTNIKYRYLVCDRSGQVWAFEVKPIRGSGKCDGHWVLPEQMCPPERVNFETGVEWHLAYRSHFANLGRPCIPISGCQLELSWEAEPIEISDLR